LILFCYSIKGRQILGVTDERASSKGKTIKATKHGIHEKRQVVKVDIVTGLWNRDQPGLGEPVLNNDLVFRFDKIGVLAFQKKGRAIIAGMASHGTGYKVRQRMK
jgi:hypothetical protein